MEVLAEETFPDGKVGAGSVSDDDVVAAKENGSRSACGTGVEETESESMATVIGNVGYLWLGANDGLWVEASGGPWVKATDGVGFRSFG